MLPTRMIRRRMADLDGRELDQLLVSLYQHHGETVLPKVGREERLERFSKWLKAVLTKDDEASEDLRIQRIFNKELPALREAWEEARNEVLSAGNMPAGPAGEEK